MAEPVPGITSARIGGLTENADAYPGQLSAAGSSASPPRGRSPIQPKLMLFDEVAHRVVFMGEGRDGEAGSPGENFAWPQNPRRRGHSPRPLVLMGRRLALPLSWSLSVAVLLSVGILKGVLTGRPLLRSRLEFASVALGSTLVGWLVGSLFERAFGTAVP